MKRVGATLAVIVVLALGAGAVWWWSQPHNAAEAFERASKKETRLAEDLRLAREADPPDAEKIARIDGRIRNLWKEFIERWSEGPETAEAQYRLLTLDLDKAAPGRERVQLIDDFLKLHPDHGKTKDLMWRRAELLRDEVKDPLTAVKAFNEIEAKFPDDPMAPKAALAAAQIYDSIHEPAAAARAYAALAEKYPNSPEAEQALMRQAALLEEQLGKKKEAADVYRKVAQANPGGAAGRQAQGRRKKLLGEIGGKDQEDYYKQTYRYTEFAPYDVSQEDFNHPIRKKIREQGFEVEHYTVDMRIDPVHKELKATTKIHGVAHKPLAEPLLLELSPTLKVDRILIGEGETTAPLKFDHKDAFLEIVLPDFAAGAEGAAATERLLDLTFDYAGKVPTWSDDSLTTEAASLWGETKWYPQTYLGDSYTQEVTLEVPDGFQAIAQGKRVAKPGPAAEKGWTKFQFEQKQPSQFMTVAVGKFRITKFEGPGGVPMEILVSSDHAETVKTIRKAMEGSVGLYIQMMGKFPFEKLAVAEVPEFPGGYGSASLILMGTIMFNEGGGPEKILAHEIAHQWFGNLLGLDLQDGSIPWLSEGFATYCDAVYTERTEGKQAFLNQIRKMGNFYRQNALAFEDRPISQTLWRNPMYRSLMYEKGALVLHELRREMGDDDFFKLLHEFVDDNRFKVVRIKDFSDKASEVAGRDLGWFFEQTLDRTGYPTVDVIEASAAPDGGGADGPWKLDLLLRQSDPAYRMRLDVRVDMEGGDAKVETIDLTRLRQDTKLEFPKKPVKVTLDPQAWYLLGGGPETLEHRVAVAGETAGEKKPAEETVAPATGR